MSALQSTLVIHHEACGRLQAAWLRSSDLKAVTGQVRSRGVVDEGTLQNLLGQLQTRGGWLQYQSHVVRPQQLDVSQGIATDHPQWGKLLDAELFGEGESPASLALRFTGDGWVVSQWQPGEGETYLAETIQRRGLGGTRLSYLRLWQEHNQQMQPDSGWLIDSQQTTEEAM